jgi:hypothetical protein
MKNRIWMAAFATIMVATIFTSRTVVAALLSMDFGVAPSPLQTGFNAMVGPSSSPTASQVIGPYTISLAGQGFFNTTNATNVNAVDASVRDFYRDYYYNNSTTPGQGVQLTIGGFMPNTPYNLKLWSYDADNASSTPTTWTPNADTSGPIGNITNIRTPAPLTLADNSATIAVTSTTGTLDVFGTTTGGIGGTRLNGFIVNDGSTDLLAVDFGQGSRTIPGFTPGLGTSVTHPSFSQVVGPYTVGLVGQGFFHSSNAGRLANLGPSVRDFFGDYYFNNSTSPTLGVELTIDGVTPNTDYYLKLWSYDNDQATPGTNTRWTPVENTIGNFGDVLNVREPFPQDLTSNNVTLIVRSTTTQLKVFGASTSGNGGTRLNGFELNLVPEPAAATLGGLAMLLAGGLPLRGRRR